MAHPFGSQGVRGGVSGRQELAPGSALFRRSRHRSISRTEATQPQVNHPKVLLEPLEPRYLLSADLMPFTVAVAPDGGDFTVRLDVDAQLLEVFDVTTGEIVDQRALQETSELRIVGSDSADRLTVDFEAPFALSLGLTFEGGLGADELHIVNGLFSSVVYHADGFGKGTVDLIDGLTDVQLNFDGVESLSDRSAAAERRFVNETGTSQQIRLADDVNPDDGISTIHSAAGDGFTAISFTSPTELLTLAAGDSGDTVILAGLDGAATAALAVEGGAGNDTLVGPDRDSTWAITGTDAGTLNGEAFASIENLSGGAGDDVFRFLGGSISGVIDGGAGHNTLDYSAVPGGIVVDLARAAATGAGQITSVDAVAGGGGIDTLRAGNELNVWRVTGLNAGTLNDLSFSDIENLEGGAADDAYVMTLTGQLTGGLSGGLGLDSLNGADQSNTWRIDSANAGTLNGLAFADIEDLLGGDQQDAFLFAVGGFVSGTIGGGRGADRLRGADKRNQWRVTGSNAGKLNGQLFKDIEQVDGGSADILSLDSTEGYLGIDPSSQTPTEPAGTLTDEALAPVLQQALMSWSSTGLADGVSDRLDQIDIRIADLAGGILGETRGATIYLDTTAAGYGWFVDPTPADDAEFGEVLSPTHLAAGLESPALGHIDLLTVVTHELGHLLGFDHTDALASGGPDVMSDILGTSMRLLTSATAFLPEAGATLEAPALLLANGATLNAVIDDLLLGFDTGSPPTGPNAEFTSGDGFIPDIITVGTTLGGGVDLELMDVTLQFSDLAFTAGSWMGQVGVTATSATLFTGLLDIVVTDDGVDTADGDDADLFAVAGVIDIAAGAPGTLNLDDLDVEALGWPGFLDVAITGLALNFPDFRGNDNQNSLELSVELRGFDTGNDTVNQLLEADNPLFGLNVQGFASAELGITEIENAVAAAGAGDLEAAMEAALAAALASDLTGLGGSISGKLFGVGSLSAAFIYDTVTYDPDGNNGPLPERSVVYLAIEGSLSLGPAITGDDNDGGIAGFGIAFAISELGPLQFFGSLDVPIVLEPITGLAISSMRLGLRFNSTIEDLQTETDFQATGATVTPDGNDFLVTLTIAGEHDLEGPTPGGTRPGDDFRIRGATETDPYNGKFTVVSVTESTVTYRVADNPGLFVGSKQITRLTIKDPLDLRDDGLNSGPAPPDDLLVWRQQLRDQVLNQITAGDNIWDVLLDSAVFGGGASLSFDPRIPDTVLSLDVDFLLDTELRILLVGKMSLLDGLVSFPTRMFADLSDLNSGSGRFLYLQTQPEVPVFDPLLVYRGAVAFEALTNGNVVNGFSISLSGGIDLNVPGFDANLNPITVTTLTLEGETTIAFQETSSQPGVKGGLELSLGFTATLSESNFVAGEIASAAGLFQLNVTVTEGATPAPGDDEVDVVIVGAARLGTQLDFLESVGLFVDASGFLRINSGSQDTSIMLPDGATISLPGNSFALRLDGSVDFRIDFNLSGDFAENESVFGIFGTFVLDFSPQGFNVAVFDEDVISGVVVPASLTIGPKASPLLEFGVLGFLAIRRDGIAADLVLTAGASLPLGLASIEATAVFIVNTTGEDVVFEIPGGATDPNRPNGLTVVIPDGAPANPSQILSKPGPGQSDLGLQALITGSPSWAEASPGAYGVVFLEGELNLLSVLELDVSGFMLLSENVVSLEANFFAGGNFLGLASASASGTVFFSSEGEFEVVVDGSVQLGPDGFNISGTAHLAISYLDLDVNGNRSKASGGIGPKTLDVTGLLTVSGEIFFIPLPEFTVGVDYTSATGAITVSVGPVPVPFIDSSCTDTFLGEICIYYPNFELRNFTFTVGNLKAVVVPPPPIVLGQVDANGVLTLNVGPNAAARNLLVNEVNEGVIIDRAGAGSQTGDAIAISMFGVTQTFDNVTSILIADMDSGDDFVEILAPVTTMVDVRFGDGRDRLRNLGSGVVIAYGDEGDDRLEGGSANDQLFGGLGHDLIRGGAGADLIEGGDETDTLIGGAGDDTIMGGAGADLIAGDLAEVSGDVNTSVFETQASATGGSDIIQGGDGADIIFGGSGSDIIAGDDGPDRMIGDRGTRAGATAAQRRTARFGLQRR
jgi:Ca2+-binding RTX toxin-like protein